MNRRLDGAKRGAFALLSGNADSILFDPMGEICAY
jgi:hypothetical protein